MHNLARAAEDRTDCVQAGRQAAEAVTAAERAARQVLEHMLEAEASLADAAEESALRECAARRQAEAQRDLWHRRLQGAGVVEAGAVVLDVSMCHRRRRRRRHHPHSHLRHRRHRRSRHRRKSTGGSGTGVRQSARQLECALAQLASAMRAPADTFNRSISEPCSATEDGRQQMVKY